MKSKLKQFIVPILMGAMADENLYGRCTYTRGCRFNPDYRVTAPKKELREFDINGNKIMAYSRKDAIKRLKHKRNG